MIRIKSKTTNVKKPDPKEPNNPKKFVMETYETRLYPTVVETAVGDVVVLELTGPSSDRLVKKFLLTCRPSDDDAHLMSSPDLKPRFEKWALRNKVDSTTVSAVKPGVMAVMYRAGYCRNSKNNGVLVVWN